MGHPIPGPTVGAKQVPQQGHTRLLHAVFGDAPAQPSLCTANPVLSPQRSTQQFCTTAGLEASTVASSPRLPASHHFEQDRSITKSHQAKRKGEVATHRLGAQQKISGISVLIASVWQHQNFSAAAAPVAHHPVHSLALSSILLLQCSLSSLPHRAQLPPHA